MRRAANNEARPGNAPLRATSPVAAAATEPCEQAMLCVLLQACEVASAREQDGMRAAVLTEVDKPLQILDLEQEAPKANEVRVQVKAAGVCMSDWHVMNGDWPLPLPMVLGHEAAGIVVENGLGVT